MDPQELTQRERPAEAEQARTKVEREEPRAVRRPAPSARRGWLVAAAVAVVVVLVGLGSLVVIDQEDPAAQALGVGEDFIAAFNAGDADAVLALLPDDAVLTDNYIGMSDGFEPLDREFFEMWMAWETAQGSVFSSPECLVAGEGSGGPVTVSCEFGWHPIAEQAVGAPPIPTTLTLVVTSGTVGELAFEFPPEFGIGDLETWLESNHPEDVQLVLFGEWNSVAEAEQGGILRAQYVEEWLAFMEAQNCTFRPEIKRMVCDA